MKAISRACPARLAAILLLSLTVLGGCQTFDRWRGKKPAPERSSSLSQMLSGKGSSSKSLDRKQKSDVEMAMARSLEKQGKADEALKIYLHVIENDESRADAHHRVALIHDRQGACDKAEKHYLAALEALPESAELHSDFGYSCYLQQRWDEAEKRLRRAVELKPTLARAHNNLGLLLARTGREEEALAEFGHAGCTKAEAHANLGLAMMLAQRWESADSHLSMAIQAQPRSQVARESYAALEAVRRPAQQAPSAMRQAEYTALRADSTVIPLPPVAGSSLR